MPPTPPAAPRRRVLRWVLIGLAALILLPAAAIAVFLATFEAEAWKPRLAAAVQDATGRTLALDGPITVKWALIPTITLHDVALANIPAGSRPQMLTVRRAELRIALPPLLSRRVEIRRLALTEPDLLLETDAEGRPNWVFTPDRPADRPGTTDPAAPARDAAPPDRVAVDLLRIERGRLTHRDGPTGATRSVEIAALEGSAPAAAPIRLAATVLRNGAPVELRAETGPLAGLASADQPWPIRVSATAEGLRLAAEGALARPAARSGWRFRVQGAAADLARLAPLLPDVPLPPLREVAFEAEIAEPAPPGDAAGEALPVAIRALILRVGESDLNPLREGLRLARLELTAPAPDQPVRIALQAMQGAIPIRLEGSLGAPIALLRAGMPWPVELALGAAEASATVQGTIADPRAMTGVDLAIALQVPDLAALAPLAGGRPLPPLRDLAVEARLAERGERFADGVHLRGLRLTSSAGDVAGEATYATGQRNGIVAQLASRRLDLDALLPPAPAAATPAQPAPAPAGRERGQRVIPDRALPIEALTLFDADLRWSVGELVAGGATWRDLTATIGFEAGRGQVAPVAVTLPGGGRAELALRIDATQDPPALRLAANLPDLDLAALLAALGQPQRFAGRVQVQAELAGRGRDTRALAATLDGGFGIAGVDGWIDAALIEPLLAPLRQRDLPLPALPERLGVSCLALRATAERGVLRSQTLLLDTAMGRIGGGGTVRLADEALDLRLLGDLQLAGLRFSAPFAVRGTLAAPTVPQDQAAVGAAAAALDAFLALQRSPDRALEGVARGLGGGASLPDCASQLAIARGGRARPAQAATDRSGAPADPAPATPREAAPAPRPPAAPPQVQQLLRGLFGR